MIEDLIYPSLTPICADDIISLESIFLIEDPEKKSEEIQHLKEKYTVFDDDKKPIFDIFVDFIKKLGYVYDSSTKEYYLFNKITGLYDRVDEEEIIKKIHFLVKINKGDEKKPNFHSSYTASIKALVKSYCDLESIKIEFARFSDTEYGDKYKIDFFNRPEDVFLNIPNKNKIIPFKNGLFNTKNEEIIPHCRYYFATDPYNHHFTLMKKEDLEQSPIKDTYLSIFPDKDTLKYYLYWVGSVLFDEKPLPCFLNFVGRGGAGKSLICTILHNVIGSRATEFLYEDLKSPHGSALFNNKIFAFAHETYKSNDLEIIKNYVAKDTLVINPKNKDIREIPLTTRFIICGNRPFDMTKDSGSSLKRRIRIIKFKNFFNKADGDIIFNELSSKDGKDWLISSAFYLWKANYYEKNAEENMQSLSMKDEFNRTIAFDPFVNWLFERCNSIDAHIVGSHFDRLNRRTVYDDYCAFCNNLETKPLSFLNWHQKMYLEYDLDSKNGKDPNGKGYTYFSYTK